MPRISRCDKLAEPERMRLVALIGEGWSWGSLAHEFHLPDSTIAAWATRNGFARNPVEAKRQAVDRLLASPVQAYPDMIVETGGETSDETSDETGGKPDTGNPHTDAAATRDAKVARLAAGVAVQIIKRLAGLAQQSDTKPRDVVAVATALDKAWGTYARINKLDDTPPDGPLSNGVLVRWEGVE